MVKLSEDQIQQLVGKYIKKSIDGWDKAFEQGGDENLPYSDPETFQSYISDLASIRADLIFKLNQGDYSMLEGSIDTLLNENGIEVSDKASPEYRKLCVEVHKAETQLLPLQQQHMQCDFSYKDQLPKIFPDVFAYKDESPSIPPPAPPDKLPPTPGEDAPQKPKQQPVKLQKVFDEYWKEKEPTLEGTICN